MDKLKNAPKYFRGTVARGAGAVEREGGDKGAGLIQHLSVITRGEALGHDVWIDPAFLAETADAINATGTKGVKSRFTHPDLSGDGLGKFLGRVKNAEVFGDQTFADLHFSETAHDTPAGDLAAYIMNLAEKEPDQFGTSIAFVPDFEAMGDPDRNRPDKRNSQNFPTARLNKLQAVDTVDDPAANPAGLFHRGDSIVREANSLLEFAFGLSDEKPTLLELELDGDRVSAWIQRFLSSHGLSVVPSVTIHTTSDGETVMGLQQPVTDSETLRRAEWLETAKKSLTAS